MGSPKPTRDSYRLRTSDPHRNPEKLSSQKKTRTRRPRPRRSDTGTATHRHRHTRHRVAAIILAVLGTLTMTQPAQAATRGDCPQYHALLKKYGLPPKIFGPIAYRESRCNFKSISKVRSTGYPDVSLLQIQGSWRTVTYRICKLKPGQNHIKALTQPDCHLRVAAYLWADGKGASNWSIRSGHGG